MKLQYLGHLMQRADSLEKILMLEKAEGRRRRRQQRWLGNMTNLMKVNLSKLREIVKDREARPAAVHGVAELDTIQEWNNKNFLQVYS